MYWRFFASRERENFRGISTSKLLLLPLSSGTVERSFSTGREGRHLVQLFYSLEQNFGNLFFLSLAAIRKAHQPGILTNCEKVSSWPG